MPHTLRDAIPLPFWGYLVGVHLLFALFLVAGGATLQLPGAPPGLPLAGLVGLLDLILGPALLFCWIARQQPRRAIVGGTAIATFGLAVVLAWLGTAIVANTLTALAALDPNLLLAVAVFAYELRMLVQLRVVLRSDNFDRAIAAATRPRDDAGRAATALSRIVAIELRLWAYTCARRAPALAAFDGDRHFHYGKQSGNASSWIAWAWINLVPTPILHLLLHQASPMIATVTTIGTVLGSLWCRAEARAARWRPLSLDSRQLYLRYGLSVDRCIARRDIRAARALGWQDLDRHDATVLAGCGGANVRIELTSGEVLHLGIDEPTALLDALAQGSTAVADEAAH